LAGISVDDSAANIDRKCVLAADRSAIATKEEPEAQTGAMLLGEFFLGRLSAETDDSNLALELMTEARSSGAYNDAVVRDVMICEGRKAQLHGAVGREKWQEAKDMGKAK
jgi:hypothetical protein